MAAAGLLAASAASAATASPSAIGRQAAADECPAIGMRDLTAPESLAATEALTAVCEVLASRAFAERLREGTWLTRCPIVPWSRGNRISGEDALAALRTLPDFELFSEQTGWSVTVAMTDTARREIRIRPAQFALWEAATPAEKGAFLNTLAHEMTHLVGMEGDPGTPRFQDSRYWLPWCGADRFISYGVGNLVEELWASGDYRPA